MTPCKIDHGAPGALPQALCRTCHPELTPTLEQRHKAATAAKQERNGAQLRESLLRRLGDARNELARAERKIARGRGSQGIAVKVQASMLRRIDKLEKEMASL